MTTVSENHIVCDGVCACTQRERAEKAEAEVERLKGMGPTLDASKYVRELEAERDRYKAVAAYVRQHADELEAGDPYLTGLIDDALDQQEES